MHYEEEYYEQDFDLFDEFDLFIDEYVQEYNRKQDWVEVIVKTLVNETSLEESLIREVVTNEFLEKYHDGYSVNAVVGMFLAEEDEYEYKTWNMVGSK